MNPSMSPKACRTCLWACSWGDWAHAGPELGPLESIMVGPESGTWQASEITIVSSRTRRTARFVCRDRLGTKAASAAFLAPVPPDCVIMGSGEAATILTKVGAGLVVASRFLRSGVKVPLLNCVVQCRQGVKPVH